MKKRILTYLLALLAVLTMLVPTWAEQTDRKSTRLNSSH